MEESAVRRGVQFEAAANWVFCKRYGRITSSDAANRAQVNLAEIRDGVAYGASILSLIEHHVGTVDAYCSQTTSPVTAEPGMILLFASALAANSDIPLTGIAAELAVVRLVLVWTFVWFLLRTGYSLVFAGAVCAIAVYLVMLLGGNQLYASYAFVLPTMLAGLALAGFVIGARAMPAIVVGFLAVGVWAGFLGNLRTSHYPMALAIVAAALFLARLPLRHTMIGLVAAVVGVLGFDRAFVAPLRAQGVDPSHTIAHSLVIGISNPPSDLARREGIQWDDAVGIAIARRLDPNVSLFTPEYEHVLFRYWMDLWRRHPSEMLSIYWSKIWSTGQSMFAFFGDTGATLFWPEKDGRVLRWTAVTRAAHCSCAVARGRDEHAAGGWGHESERVGNASELAADCPRHLGSIGICRGGDHSRRRYALVQRRSRVCHLVCGRRAV